jgi:hypothetical protein
MGKFIVSKNKATISKNYKNNRKKISNTTDKLTDLKIKISRIDKEKEMVQVQLWRKRRRIETDMEEVKKNPANIGKKNNFKNEKKMLRDIQNKLFSSLKELDNKKIRLSSEIGKLNDKLKSINYYTGIEHKRHVRKITKEIIAAIQKISAQKGILSVLNSGRFHFPRIEKKSKDFDFNRIYDPSTEIIPFSIYDKGYSIDNMIELHGGVAASHGILDSQMEMYSDNMKESLVRMSPFVEENLSDLILLGGEDITAEVLKEILAKYSIKKETFNSTSLYFDIIFFQVLCKFHQILLK